MASTSFTEADIEAEIFRLLAMRQNGATICPSEVARSLLDEDARWRDGMGVVRQVANRLAQDDRLQVTRKGVQVDATSPGGPIRLGLPGKRRA